MDNNTLFDVAAVVNRLEGAAVSQRVGERWGLRAVDAVRLSRRAALMPAREDQLNRTRVQKILLMTAGAYSLPSETVNRR